MAKKKTIEVPLLPADKYLSISFVEDLVGHLLTCIGEDCQRNGLQETPKRVVKSWAELYKGYGTDVSKLFTVFEEPCDELVVLKGIEFYSTCEHHMLPFFGKAHIGYLPGKKGIVGVSKLARVLEAYSRRLQVQERLGKQVTEALMEYLQPKGCGIVLEAQHFCMVARGVQKQNSVMITSSMMGVFRKDAKIRNEFLQLIK